LLLAAVERVVPNLGDVLLDHVLLTPAALERRLGLPGGAIHP